MKDILIDVKRHKIPQNIVFAGVSSTPAHANKIPMAPNKIINWEFSDRPISELGDITSLANEFTKIGQQQPCLVIPHPDKVGHYELIKGERRWMAAKKANIA